MERRCGREEIVLLMQCDSYPLYYIAVSLNEVAIPHFR